MRTDQLGLGSAGGGIYSHPLQFESLLVSQHHCGLEELSSRIRDSHYYGVGGVKGWDRAVNTRKQFLLSLPLPLFSPDSPHARFSRFP